MDNGTLRECHEIRLFKVRLIEITARIAFVPYMDNVLRGYLLGSYDIIIRIGDSVTVQYDTVSDYCVAGLSVKIGRRQVKVSDSSQLQYVVSDIVVYLILLEQPVYYIR